MLPDPLNAALPAIVRGAVRVAPDPRLSPGYEWPAAERPHVVALADWAVTNRDAIEAHRDEYDADSALNEPAA